MQNKKLPENKKSPQYKLSQRYVLCEKFLVKNKAHLNKHKPPPPKIKENVGNYELHEEYEDYNLAILKNINTKF